MLRGIPFSELWGATLRLPEPMIKRRGGEGGHVTQLVDVSSETMHATVG